MDFPSFLQRSLIPKGSDPSALDWSYHPPEPPCPIFLPGVPKLLSPAPSMWPQGQEPRVPGPKHPPTLEGSQRFPLTSWLPGDLSACSCASVCTLWAHQLGGHASPVLCCDVSSPAISVSAPVGSVDPWGWGVRASLIECKRTAAQRALERRPPSLWSDHARHVPAIIVGLSPVQLLLFLFLTKACATSCP